MMQLMALAMNPNLSEKEFRELSEKIMADKARLIQTATDCMERLPPDQRMEYFRAVFPLLSML